MIHDERWFRPLLVVVLMSSAVACGFSSGGTMEVPPDGGTDIDAPLPPATVGFAASKSTQDERSGNIDLAVVLSRPATSTITIAYRFAGGDAIAGTDYNGTDGTLTFATGDQEKGIPISITADSNDEGDETILLELDAPTGDAVLGPLSTHALTISGRFLPRVQFSLLDSAQTEPGGEIVLNLSLDAMSPDVVDVGYSVGGTASGTGEAFPDHALAAGTITFPPNTQSQTISLPITNDDYDEDNETVVVTLVTSVNAVVETLNGVDRRTHTIEDEDDPPSVSFSPSVSEQENTTTVTATATLSIRSEKTVVVPIALGTPATNPATLGTDFTVPAGADLTFGPGQTTRTFAITVNEDNADEFDELVEVVLGPGNANVSLGTPAAYTLTITNEDTASRVSFATNSKLVNEGDSGTNAQTFNVSLDKASGKPITVGVTIGGDASNPGDYTIDTGTPIPIVIPAGNTASSITVQIKTDTSKENNSGGTEDVDLRLVNAGSSNVTINTTNGADFRRLTIRDDD